MGESKWENNTANGFRIENIHFISMSYDGNVLKLSQTACMLIMHGPSKYQSQYATWIFGLRAPIYIGLSTIFHKTNKTYLYFFPSIFLNFKNTQYTCIINAILLKIKVEKVFSSRKERSDMSNFERHCILHANFVHLKLHQTAF